MSKIFLLLALLIPTLSFANVCSQWSEPKQIGSLDTKLLPETSGMAFSRQFPGRLYHHNDSGDGPFFYLTDLEGKNTQKVQMNLPTPKDIEDMAIGPCTEGQCLYLGDIGDNKEKRENIEIYILPEQKNYSGKTFPRVVRLQYPDHAHNAESLAVHPVTGDLYILTKEADYDERRAQVAQLFRLPAEKLATATLEMETLEKVNSIDLPWLTFEFGLWGQIATSMDISPNGEKLAILTYQAVVEVPLVKALNTPSRQWDEKDYQIIPLNGLLPQMEAIAYSTDGKSLLIDSESPDNRKKKDSPLMQIDCLDQLQ